MTFALTLTVLYAATSHSAAPIDKATIQRIEREVSSRSTGIAYFEESWRAYELNSTGMNAFKAATTFYFMWSFKDKLPEDVKVRLKGLYNERKHTEAISVAVKKYPESPYPLLVEAALVNSAEPPDWNNVEYIGTAETKDLETGKTTLIPRYRNNREKRTQKLYKLIGEANSISRTDIGVAMYYSMKLHAGDTSRSTVNNLLASLNTDTYFINKGLYTHLHKNPSLLSDNNKKAVDAALTKFDRDWAGTHFGK